MSNIGRVLLALMIVAAVGAIVVATRGSDRAEVSATGGGHLSSEETPGDDPPIDRKESDPDHEVPPPEADDHDDYEPPPSTDPPGPTNDPDVWACVRPDGSGRSAHIDTPSPGMLEAQRVIAITEKQKDVTWEPDLSGFPPAPDPDCVPPEGMPTWEEFIRSRSTFAVLDDDGNIVNADGSLTIVAADGTVRIEQGANR